MRRVDLVGKRFGRLHVISFAYSKNQRLFWECVCDCGNKAIVRGSSLTSGNTKSCGCLQREIAVLSNIRHGVCLKNGGMPHLRNIHRGMIHRCENVNSNMYKNYGGRGIKVCDQWHDLKNFAEWAINNGYKEGLQIDRIDNDKGYYPENCRFVTPFENSNNRRNTVFVKIRGEKLPLRKAAKKYGVKWWTIVNRLKAGYTGEMLIRKENLSGCKVGNDIKTNAR